MKQKGVYSYIENVNACLILFIFPKIHKLLEYTMCSKIIQWPFADVMLRAKRPLLGKETCFSFFPHFYYFLLLSFPFFFLVGMGPPFSFELKGNKGRQEAQ